MKNRSAAPALFSLDTSVSLSQELNLSSAPLLRKAAAGGLSSPGRASAGPPEPEELLALAVVGQAVEDWRLARSILRRVPDHPRAACLKRDAERFFRSRWFCVLVDLDGRALLSRLRREAESLAESGRS